MNPYVDNPDLALATLEKIAEEIPSGVSAEDMGEIVPKLGTCPMEIHESMRRVIVETFKSNIRVFWEEQNVKEKLEKVKELKCTEEPFRSIISQEDLKNTADAKYLRLMKESLLAKIKKVQEENACLEKVLREKSEMVNRQMDSVKKCDLIL